MNGSQKRVPSVAKPLPNDARQPERSPDPRPAGSAASERTSGRGHAVPRTEARGDQTPATSRSHSAAVIREAAKQGSKTLPRSKVKSLRSHLRIQKATQQSATRVSRTKTIRNERNGQKRADGGGRAALLGNTERSENPRQTHNVHRKGRGAPRSCRGRGAAGQRGRTSRGTERRSERKTTV